MTVYLVGSFVHYILIILLIKRKLAGPELLIRSSPAGLFQFTFPRNIVATSNRFSDGQQLPSNCLVVKEIFVK